MTNLFTRTGRDDFCHAALGATRPSAALTAKLIAPKHREAALTTSSMPRATSSWINAGRVGQLLR